MATKETRTHKEKVFASMLEILDDITEDWDIEPDEITAQT